MFQAWAPLGGGEGSRGLIWHITSPVLIRKFQTHWFEVTFLVEPEAAIKSWFVVLGASYSTLSLVFFLLNISQFS